MRKRGVLADQLWKEFSQNAIDPLIIPLNGGKAYNLVFLFRKSECEDPMFSKALDCVAEDLANSIQGRGINVNSYGSGFATEFGGHCIEVQIPSESYELASEMRMTFKRSTR